MKFELPKPVTELISVLERNGYEAYIVGGCVRDFLLGKHPHDFDITTSALPEQTITCFSGYKVIETGLKHGTVTVVVNHEPYEITTYRVDGEYTDNRHPDAVSFVSSLKEDLKRRDFTINAMAYSPAAGLIDYFGGQDDLKLRSICCVGDPLQRFQEDALRIMRAIRFASTYGFEIENDTADAIHNKKELLGNIAAERIQAELNRLLCGNNVKKMLLQFSDVLSFIIPEIKPMIGLYQKSPYHYLDAWEHTVESVSQAPESLILRLTMLLHDIGKPQCYIEDKNGTGHFYGHPKISSDTAFEILKRLRYDNLTMTRVRDLIVYHDAEIEPQHKIIRRWLNKLGEETFRQLLYVKRADIKAQSEIYRQERLEKIEILESALNEVVNQHECFCLKELAINGRDLIEIGFPEGRAVGAALNKLMDLVIDGNLKNNKEALIKKAIELLIN